MLGDSFPANRFSIDFGKYTVETVQTVSGLATGFDVVEAMQVGKIGQATWRKQAGGTGGGAITIVRGPEPSKALTDWVTKTLADQKPDEVRQNLTISMKDEKGETVRRVHLTNAWASSWTTGDADATGGETVTIAYETLTVE
ncbi:phage tail protein [Streptomyces sp. NPDC046876]|uniref:phage tail protein n=1 Tax=Streptomyces sp. NPDC046876 TaxID=3155616 RepID=UPI0033F0EAEB